MSLTYEDQVAVDRLNARYGMTTDDGDGPGFASCFTRRGVFVSSTRGEISGHDALATFVEEVSARNGVGATTHWISPALLSGTREHATSTCNALVVANGAEPKILASVRYQDELEKTPDGWRFRRRTVITHRETNR
jgi:hypothetical protein